MPCAAVLHSMPGVLIVRVCRASSSMSDGWLGVCDNLNALYNANSIVAPEACIWQCSVGLRSAKPSCSGVVLLLTADVVQQVPVLQKHMLNGSVVS